MRIELCERRCTFLRYLFDVHDDGPAVWGDEEEYDGRSTIEYRARELIEQAQEQQLARGSVNVLTSVFVHEEDDGIVLIASARPGADIKFVWVPK